MLKSQPNGDCFYLGADGCTIHEHAPFMCKIYDCREQHRMYSKEVREDMVRRGLLNKEILRRGAILRHQGEKNAAA